MPRSTKLPGLLRYRGAEAHRSAVILRTSAVDLSSSTVTKSCRFASGTCWKYSASAEVRVEDLACWNCTSRRK